MRYSKIGYWRPQIISIAVMVAGAATVLRVLPPGPSVLKAIAVSALTTACLALALSSYRSADEVILQQHKTAWFWGSMIALCAIVPLAIAVTWHLFAVPVPAPEYSFDAGVLSLMGLQVICYLLYGLVARLRSGRP